MNRTILSFSLALALMTGAVQADVVNYRSSVQIPNKEWSDHEERAALQKSAKISLDQARQFAAKRYPRAVIVDADLENHEGQVVYEVDLEDGALERTLILDAGNGRLLFEKSEPRD